MGVEGGVSEGLPLVLPEELGGAELDVVDLVAAVAAVEAVPGLG